MDGSYEIDGIGVDDYCMVGKDDGGRSGYGGMCDVK